jgi:hypothetical protein
LNLTAAILTTPDCGVRRFPSQRAAITPDITDRIHTNSSRCVEAYAGRVAADSLLLLDDNGAKPNQGEA